MFFFEQAYFGPSVTVLLLWCVVDTRGGIMGLCVELLLELDTELLTDTLEGVYVLLVLGLVLDLLLDALKDTDGGGVVVDTPAGAESRLNDLGGGDEVVGEAVVEAALELKEVLYRVKEADVARVEGLERLLLVVCRGVESDWKESRIKKKESVDIDRAGAGMGGGGGLTLASSSSSRRGSTESVPGGGGGGSSLDGTGEEGHGGCVMRMRLGRVGVDEV